MYDFDLSEDWPEHDHHTVTGESFGDLTASGGGVIFEHCELGHVIGSHPAWVI